MKKKCSLIGVMAIAGIIGFGGLVSAHNKVVVVPLSGAKTTSSGAEWIRIYDNNDVFFGYLLDHEIVVSSEYHYAYMPHADYYTLGAIYLSSDCSGKPYYEVPQSVTPFTGPGRIMGRSHDSKLYYLPKNPSIVTVPTGTELYQFDSLNDPVGCKTLMLYNRVIESVYELLPNDPNVTGFPDTFESPLKAVYTLPASP